MDELLPLGEMGTLADAVAPELERLQSAPGTYLPLPAVEAQAALARHTQHELQRLIIDAAVALAVRIDGTAHPRHILRDAAEAATFAEWESKVKPEIKRVIAQRA